MSITNYNTISHKNNENDNISINSEDGACFVCLTKTAPDNSLPVELTDITILKKNCECRALIHTSCLAEWFLSNRSCPVCRNDATLVYNNNNITENTESEYYINIETLNDYNQNSLIITDNILPPVKKYGIIYIIIILSIITLLYIIGFYIF